MQTRKNTEEMENIKISYRKNQKFMRRFRLAFILVYERFQKGFHSCFIQSLSITVYGTISCH